MIKKVSLKAKFKGTTSAGYEHGETYILSLEEIRGEVHVMKSPRHTHRVIYSSHAAFFENWTDIETFEVTNRLYTEDLRADPGFNPNAVREHDYLEAVKTIRKYRDEHRTESPAITIAKQTAKLELMSDLITSVTMGWPDGEPKALVKEFLNAELINVTDGI